MHLKKPLEALKSTKKIYFEIYSQQRLSASWWSLALKYWKRQISIIIIIIYLHCITQYYAQQGVFWKPGKTSNFDPSILPYKFGLIFMGMKQNFFFFRKKNPKWPTQKKLIFQNRQFSKWVLGLVGLNDVQGIDVAQRIWP